MNVSQFIFDSRSFMKQLFHLLGCLTIFGLMQGLNKIKITIDSLGSNLNPKL